MMHGCVRRLARLAVGCAMGVVAVASMMHAALAAPALLEKTAGMEARRGLLTIYLDRDGGRVWLRTAPPDAAGHLGTYLYYEALASGLGSNPVGLDRSQLGETRLVALRRVGNRVMIEQRNTRYRALSEDPEERRATAESFATSVLWAGEIAAEAADGGLLVDLSSFLVRDTHGVAAALERSGQGSFTLDRDRSAVDLEACKAFPRNLALTSVLTFGGTKPGPEVRATAPEPTAVTLVLRHLLVQLPDPGYRPRRFDPRAGSFAIEFADYAAPLDRPIDTRWIVRHRLEKRDPRAPRSPAVAPIVYYVDRGVPEPVRSALLEGARWWAAAFEAAGFVDAFRVELLPPDADPLDVRYNVINWVHRATRGWSYGGGVIDPRTGEMIKGHVLLGSLRVRQDRLLFEGLVGADRSGTGGPDDPVQLALARIRQLAAHEVGHTLGLAHNFAASTYGRASVMDYPAPWVRVGADGTLDFRDAYGVGVGAWDVFAIRYAYTQFPAGADETAELEGLVAAAQAQGLEFVSDADARPAGAANPRGNLWDNEAAPEEDLWRVVAVRRYAMANFGIHNVRAGAPLALLEEVFAPVYFMHRFAVPAVAKVVGGLDYRYAVRGDEPASVTPLDAGRQRRALALLLETLEPEFLDIPEPTLRLLHPRPFGYGESRERFASATRPGFDALGAAASAARLTVRTLVQPERDMRLIDQHRRDPDLPGLPEVLEALRDRVFETATPADARRAAVQRAVQRATLDVYLEQAQDARTPAALRAMLDAECAFLRERLARQRGGTLETRAHRAALVADLERHGARTLQATRPQPAAPPPPGSPIGSAPGGLPSFEGCDGPWFHPGGSDFR